MSQSLELPDEVYKALSKAARERGLTPAEWLALHLPVNGEKHSVSLTEFLRGLTATFDSTQQPEAHYPANPYGKALAEKFRKQGLTTP